MSIIFNEKDQYFSNTSSKQSGSSSEDSSAEDEAAEKAEEKQQNDNVETNITSSKTEKIQEEPEQMRKLFIGGLDYRTSETTLRKHFESFGEVIDCIVMREPQSKRSRGFGFITYKHSSMVDNAQEARPHKIEGREVQSKRAISREDSKLEAQATVKKVYLGGLSDDIEESELRSYFKEFGNIVNVNIVSHKDTGKRRGFAFVEYDDYDPVDKIVLHKFHTIKDNRIEAKKAISKIEMDARKRVDPRTMAMGPGPMVLLPGTKRARVARNNGGDPSLWEGSPYGGVHYQPSGYLPQSGYPYQPHHHTPSTHYGGSQSWMMNPGPAAGNGMGAPGPYNNGPNGSGGGTGGFRGGYGDNYNLGSNWPAPVRNYSCFPPSQGGGAGSAGPGGGPMRLAHSYRWGPYEGGHGGAHRGRGYNS